MSIVPAALFLLLAAQQQDQKVYRVGEEGIKSPRLVYRVEPEYTDTARDAQVKGVVVLSLEITDQGKTEHVKVLKGLEPSLDRNAATAVSKWRFAPPVKADGTAVRVRVTVEISFRNL
jgi:TonB family protein